jgi:hypothetical protein
MDSGTSKPAPAMSVEDKRRTDTQLDDIQLRLENEQLKLRLEKLEGEFLAVKEQIGTLWPEFYD